MVLSYLHSPLACTEYFNIPGNTRAGISWHGTAGIIETVSSSTIVSLILIFGNDHYCWKMILYCQDNDVFSKGYSLPNIVHSIPAIIIIIYCTAVFLESVTRTTATMASQFPKGAQWTVHPTCYTWIHNTGQIQRSLILWGQLINNNYYNAA